MSKRNPSKLKGKQNKRKLEMQKRSKIVNENAAARLLRQALSNPDNLICEYHPAKRDTRYRVWIFDGQEKTHVGWTSAPTSIDYVMTLHGYKQCNQKLDFSMPVLEPS